MESSRSGCFKFLKLALFIFNFIFWIIGIAILIIGITLRVGSGRGTLFSDIPFHYTGSYLLIMIGIVMTITGFLGCCGALRESQCMLFSFFLVLSLIFILLLSAGIWAVASQQMLKNKLRETLIKNVMAYDSGEVNDRTENMDFIQNRFNCCGVSGKADYGIHEIKVPRSCGKTIQIKIARPGCYQALLTEGKNNLMTVAGVGIGVGLIMIIGMCFSIIVCCAIRDGVR